MLHRETQLLLHWSGQGCEARRYPALDNSKMEIAFEYHVHLGLTTNQVVDMCQRRICNMVWQHPKFWLILQREDDDVGIVPDELEGDVLELYRLSLNQLSSVEKHIPWNIPG